MNPLSCRTVEETLAAFAADALEPEDKRDMALHLAECRNHDDELQALRGDFAALAAAVPPQQPPASLRASLLDAFDREQAAPAADEPVAEAPRQIVPALRMTPAAWFGYALAAALLVVAIGLGAWGASRGDDGDDVIVATTREGGASLQLTYLPDRGLGVIDVDLPALDADQDYQAWGIDTDGNAVSLGVLPGNQGRIALEGDLRSATAIALSVEPTGGSPAPTSDPILATALN